MNRLDLAVLHKNCITLGSVVTEDGSGIEFEAKITSELTRRVTKKAKLLLRIECLSPCVHTDLDQLDICDKTLSNLHESIVNRDDEHLSDTVDLGGSEVAWDVSV